MPVAVCFSHCSGNSHGDGTAAKDSTVTAPPAFDTLLTKGQVADSVVCRKNPAVSYALYIPSYLGAGKRPPCIILFDPHARGALPVRMYKDIAEKYGFVLAGSNVSKNGTVWPVTNEGVNAILTDVKARINPDLGRIYTAGFSGGSRVAASVAMLDGGIEGVIGCGAGLPQAQPKSKFEYFGMVSMYDFNLGEMQQLDDAMEQSGFTHQLLTSDGIHAWPSAKDFKTAVRWMQLQAMKKKLQPINDTIISELKEDFSERITTAEAAKEWIREGELLSGATRALDGIADVTAFKKQMGDLSARQAYKDAVALQHQIQDKEQVMQQELVSKFTTQDVDWWTRKIAELNRNAKAAKNRQESQMYRRVVNYLGLVGYMSASHALNTGDLANALNYLKIYKMADPKNPDCDYLYTIYYVKNGNNSEAIASLKTAVALGYSDVAQLVNDPALLALQHDPAFADVVTEVRRNYDRKD